MIEKFWKPKESVYISIVTASISLSSLSVEV